MITKNFNIVSNYLNDTKIVSSFTIVAEDTEECEKQANERFEEFLGTLNLEEE